MSAKSGENIENLFKAIAVNSIEVLSKIYTKGYKKYQFIKV